MTNRILAGAAALAHHDDVRVLALPRGGVPVAYPVARALDAPLDVFLVRKLGAPSHPELGMGAVTEGGLRVPFVVRGPGIAAGVWPTAEAFLAARRYHRFTPGDGAPMAQQAIKGWHRGVRVAVSALARPIEHYRRVHRRSALAGGDVEAEGAG